MWDTCDPAADLLLPEQDGLNEVSALVSAEVRSVYDVEPFGSAIRCNTRRRSSTYPSTSTCRPGKSVLTLS